MLEINFKNNPSKEIQQIINNYWATENDIFIFEAKNLLSPEQKNQFTIFWIILVKHLKFSNVKTVIPQ